LFSNDPGMRFWLLFFLFTSPLLAQTSDYATLLQRAKQSDPTLNFEALRRAYTNLPGYNGYVVPKSAPMIKAANEEDWDLAKKEAKSLLEQNYLDLYAHQILLMVAEQNKDSAAAAHHEYMLDGLMTAICGGRDGKSEKSAWPILSVREQYQVCQILGWRVKGRGLVHGEGGPYDVTTVVTQDGDERTVYFDVSGFFGKL